ncbi:hypothetical protein C8R43DRAFT_1126390 [Mycena crocata]|nr:hypothetical protein C8R43DRAFT_1126390 [Mycena crocata]
MSFDTNQVIEELAPWKRKRFRDYELSWVKAAESLGTSNPLIEVRPNKSGSRWTVYDKATDKLAIFTHAGLWLWASPPHTGNYVPPGEAAPPGVYENRIADRLNIRAETSYAFNTRQDPSFYAAARLVENHLIWQDGFNKLMKPRRNWQIGETEEGRQRFILSARLVIRKTPYNMKDVKNPYKAPYKLHPWVDAALNEQEWPYWIPNPDMPSIVDYVDGKLNMVKPENNRYFDANDIVWFSFALTFDFSGNFWMPEYKPLDFVRVGKLSVPPESRGEYSIEAEVGAAYRSLTEGIVALLEDEEDEDSTAEVYPGVKRPRDSDGDETMSEGGRSDKSAYSAALVAFEEDARKRQKMEQGSGAVVAVPPKPPSKVDDSQRRRSSGKAKGRT